MLGLVKPVVAVVIRRLAIAACGKGGAGCLRHLKYLIGRRLVMVLSLAPPRTSPFHCVVVLVHQGCGCICL